MKFVDQATITVSAGHGGNGCLSFRRERFIARGGPDGGDGGDGGSVYLRTRQGINTLAEFRYTRSFQAARGADGGGRNRSGKCGDDLYIDVPIGTTVYDHNTGERIGDLTQPEQVLLVASGGFHGLGNTRFKSSTTRAPRKTTQGSQGDWRELRLELRLLADVGLLGMPSVGKSSLICALSNARPRIAAYPFTTLHPHLGVVKAGRLQSYVMADLPGLIAGAAQGQGLGIQFLKHLSRCRLLLHMLDVNACGQHQSPVNQFTVIEKELCHYGEAVTGKPRWLVINKIDLLVQTEVQTTVKQICRALDWRGPRYAVSTLNRAGLDKLNQDILAYLQAAPTQHD